MKKNYNYIGAVFIFYLFSAFHLYALDRDVGKWSIKVDETTAKADIYYGETLLIKESCASFKNGDKVYFQSDAQTHQITESDWHDMFGSGTCVTVLSTMEDGISVKQYYYLYPDREYMLTDFYIESEDGLESNYLAPVVTESEVLFLPENGNRILFVPFDNDMFVEYSSHTFRSSDFASHTSFEVGALYNEESLNGFVTGSVEHTNWKTGVTFSAGENNKVNKMEIYGGVTSSVYTHDLKEHGSLKGNSIKSPKIFIGYFDDWRAGMETYGDANALVTPKAPWHGEKPFGWNSWGVLQTNINYNNATQTAEFIKNNLPDFSARTVYIGLDSWWNENISDEELRVFVQECKARGQKVGIYFDPFTFWGELREDWKLYDTSYLYICLKGNGEYFHFDGAYAMDPTHPLVKRRIKENIDKFIRLGIDYLKIDFLSHGTVEADSYYDKSITTGIQAYNQGMQYIYDCIGGKMYLNLSIAPLFPSHYAQSRRIACDAYYNISDTEYTLNSLTYGWWLDRVYSYNDADHVVLRKGTLGSLIAAGVNRARITSSIITGIFILGDDFTNNNSQTRANTHLTNPEINRMARQSKAFRPVYSASSKAADMFYHTFADTTYIAAFNYTSRSASRTFDFDRLGLITGENYIVKELWGNTTAHHSESWSESVNSNDVKLFKIYPETPSSALSEDVEWINAGEFPAEWVIDGRLIWGDYDNDGYLDAFYIAGQGGGNVALFRNKDGEGFEQVDIDIEPLNWASAVFMDYNNDGNLDLIVSGRTNEKDGDREIVTRVYRNTGAPGYNYIEDAGRSAELPGVASGTMEEKDRPGRFLQAVDYDHDGWVDLILCGLSEDSYITAVYRNNEGSFERVTNLVDGNDLPQVGGGSVHIGDVNNDGYADLFIQGWNTNGVAGLYINNQDGTFTYSPSSFIFTGSTGSETIFADINGDGYDDLVEINGTTANIYINNKNNTFTPYGEFHTGIMRSGASSIAAGDVNHNGRLDLLVSGFDVITKIHYNNGNHIYTSIDAPSEIVARSGNVSFVDINRDGKLDISNFGYHPLEGRSWTNAYMFNNMDRDNEAPTVPADFEVIYSEDEGKFLLTWKKSTDDHTPADAIRYNIYVEDTDNNTLYAYAPVNTETGRLNTAGTSSNLLTTTSMALTLPESNYVFGVQAIDQADVASLFATYVYEYTPPVEPPVEPPVVGIDSEDVAVMVRVVAIGDEIHIANNMPWDLNYTIYSVNGHQIKTGTCLSGSTSDMTGFKSGVYVVRAFHNGFVYTTKVLIK